MKDVLWSFLFPLIPSLWNLGEHASRYSHAKMTTQSCINLEVKACVNRTLHNLLQMTKHVPLPSRTPFFSFPKKPKQEDFHAHSCFHAFCQKGKMESVQTCWLYSLSRVSLLMFSPLHFPCPKCTQASLELAWNAQCFLTLIFTQLFKLSP